MERWNTLPRQSPQLDVVPSTRVACRQQVHQVVPEWIRKHALKWLAEWIDPCDLVPFGSEIKDRLIFELEVFASVQGAIDLLEERSHVDVVLFTDNQAALACLVNGRAEGVAACILQKLVNLEEENDINFWFEWVPSQSNPSDAPSRKEIDHLDSSLSLTGPSCVGCGGPDLFGHVPRTIGAASFDQDFGNFPFAKRSCARVRASSFLMIYLRCEHIAFISIRSHL